MLSFDIAAAHLVGVICEAVLYGLYLATCWFCARTLLLTDDNRGMRLVRLQEIRWLLTSISMVFFIVSTWDMATGILHLFNAFIKAEDPTVEFNKPADWINTARALNLGLSVLLGDFVLVYKCWIIYNRRWLVITPSIILYLGAIAMHITLILQIAPGSQAHTSVTMMALCPWGTTMFAINAFQNIFTTGMIVWRIWRIGRGIEQNTNYPGGRKEIPRRPMQKVMRVFVESGAIYTTAGLATFLVSAAGSNAVYIPADISLQTAGIIFNIIIVRSIERNDRVGVADPENGRIAPIFQDAVRDASVELSQSLGSKQSSCSSGA